MLAVAGGVLDGVVDTFLDGVGAPSAVAKGGRDFATAVDLELEQRLSAELADRTGIPVHGEEFGGPALDTGTVWLIDPIDGTMNYSFGLPTAGILVALLQDGDPILGLTWLPMVNRRYAAAAGGPLLCNGEPQPSLESRDLEKSLVALGAFNLDSQGAFPGRYRARVLGELSRVCRRARMHGSAGADLAFTAAGSLGATVLYGDHPWDNAPGVALVRAAGGVVTDLAGQPWHLGSRSVLAAAPGVHEQVTEILASLGDPGDYRDGVSREGTTT